MVKTYSYHVYQPKANSKHGRFVDLDSNTGKGDALSGGNNKQLKRSKDGNTKRIVGTGPGGQLGDGTDSQAAELHLHAGPTDQLFAATHKAILHSQQQQQQQALQAHQLAGMGAWGPPVQAPSTGPGQYVFSNFKMKARPSSSANGSSGSKRGDPLSGKPGGGVGSLAPMPHMMPAMPYHFMGGVPPGMHAGLLRPGHHLMPAQGQDGSGGNASGPAQGGPMLLPAPLKYFNPMEPLPPLTAGGPESAEFSAPETPNMTSPSSASTTPPSEHSTPPTTVPPSPALTNGPHGRTIMPRLVPTHMHPHDAAMATPPLGALADGSHPLPPLSPASLAFETSGLAVVHHEPQSAASVLAAMESQQSLELFDTFLTTSLPPLDGSDVAAGGPGTPSLDGGSSGLFDLYTPVATDLATIAMLGSGASGDDQCGVTAVPTPSVSSGLNALHLGGDRDSGNRSGDSALGDSVHPDALSDGWDACSIASDSENHVDMFASWLVGPDSSLDLAL